MDAQILQHLDDIGTEALWAAGLNGFPRRRARIYLTAIFEAISDGRAESLQLAEIGPPRETGEHDDDRRRYRPGE